MAYKFFENFTIHKFNELDSTNSFANQLLKSDKANHGDVIIAGFQSGGRGQSQNTWYSGKDKNMLLSVICKDININVTSLFYINMIVSIALYDILKIYLKNEKIEIKWPNDILVNESKIAGILIESNISGEKIKNLIIGIGLNVNEEEFPYYLNNACSLYTLSKNYFNIDEIAALFLDTFNISMTKYKDLEKKEIKDNYKSHLYGINIKKYFRRNGNRFSGIIKGINNSGQLIVDVNNEIINFNNKEIEFERGSN